MDIGSVVNSLDCKTVGYFKNWIAGGGHGDLPAASSTGVSWNSAMCPRGRETKP